MSNTQKSSQNIAKPWQIAQRATFTLFLFSGVLTATLLVSETYVIPNFTKVELDGVERDLDGIQSYHNTLLAELSTAEEKRKKLLIPTKDELFISLKESREQDRDFLQLQKQFVEAAHTFRSGDMVAISALHLVEHQNRVVLTGDIRNAGPASMTTLMQFVEYLRGQSFIAGIPIPRFSREQNKEIGFYSPFTLDITLR